jgi:hypothetical protein
VLREQAALKRDAPCTSALEEATALLGPAAEPAALPAGTTGGPTSGPGG